MINDRPLRFNIRSKEQRRRGKKIKQQQRKARKFPHKRPNLITLIHKNEPRFFGLLAFSRKAATSYKNTPNSS